MNVNSMGNYFEDFIVGEEINHSLSKTIFECDNNLFSLMTMNHHPVHTNIDYAEKNQHGKILVVAFRAVFADGDCVAPYACPMLL